MSLILDALRGARARATPRPTSNAAQTDAVLQTLGYGRFNSASLFSRIKRLAGYLVAGILLAALTWGTVVWATRAYLLRHPSPAVSPTGGQLRPSALAPASPTAAPAMPDPATAPPPATPGQVADFDEQRPSVVAPVSRLPSRAATSPSSSVASRGTPSSAGGAAPVGAATLQTLPLVHNSRRADVPGDLPVPPAGTPASGTALSVSAGSNAGMLVSESDHFQLALYYQRIGDFENSLVHYRAVLQRDELNAEAHNNLGLLYRDKGLFDDAVKEFVRAIAINQRYVKAHNNLGVAYLSQHRNDAASAEFRTALGLDPRNVESLVNLSLAEKEAGRRDDARATLARAIEIDPRNAEARYNMALIADEAGDKAQALIQYRAFLQYATDHPDLVPEVRKRIDALSR